MAAVLLIAVNAAHSQSLDALSFDEKLRLATAGDADAQVAVARAYEVFVNETEAANWYRKAADQGNAEAMVRLARIFSRGVPGAEKNLETAAALYETAARQGHVEAQNWLGYCYHHGLGIQQSDAGAVEWYTKASNSGLAAAQSNLGLMYLAGKGVPTNARKAFELFDQAAKRGDVWGLNNLGGLYEMGWGVGQDRQKALIYYYYAVEKGNKTAGQNFERLSASLGSDAAAMRGIAARKTGGIDAVSSPAVTENDLRPTSPLAKPKKIEVEPRAGGKRQARPTRRSADQKRQDRNAACRTSFLERLFLGRRCK